MKKIYAAVIVAICVVAGSIVLCKRKARRLSKVSITKGMSVNSDQKNRKKEVDTDQMIIASLSDDVLSGMSDERPKENNPTPDNQASNETENIKKEGKHWEGVVLACKTAGNCDAVEKKMDIVRNDIKDLFIEFTQEAASNMSDEEKKIAHTSVSFIETFVKELLNFAAKLQEPGLSKSDADKIKLEYQIKLSQLVLAQSSNLELLSKTLECHSEIGDIKLTTETINSWLDACNDFFGDIKIAFGDTSRPVSTDEIFTEGGPAEAQQAIALNSDIVEKEQKSIDKI